MKLALTIVMAYLLGSIPFGYILVRVFRGTDVRASGSGNIGATNVARTSPALGVATLVLDALKGWLAVVLAVLIFRDSGAWQGWQYLNPFHPASGFPWSPSFHLILQGATIAALFAVIGHIFPVWLKFRGGKGVATGLGAFLLIAPKAVLAIVGIFAVVVFAFRYVSLGSIVAVALFPFLAWMLYHPAIDAISLSCMTLSALLILGKHHENIRRLLAGTENRLAMRQG